MLSELVDKLVRLGQDASLPKVLRCDREPDHVYYLVTEDGAKRQEAEPAPRKHKALDLTALFDMAVGFDDKEQSPAEVWYSRSAVVAFLDSKTRRDEVRLCLQRSPQLNALVSADAKSLGQGDFIQLLRVGLANCVPPSLLTAIRQVRFRQESQSTSNTGHAKASIGKSLEAELLTPCTLPDMVEIILPAFHGYDACTLYKVLCALDVDPKTERFMLQILPGEVERLEREAEDRLGSRLRTVLAEQEISVLYGNP